MHVLEVVLILESSAPSTVSVAAILFGGLVLRLLLEGLEAGLLRRVAGEVAAVAAANVRCYDVGFVPLYHFYC